MWLPNSLTKGIKIPKIEFEEFSNQNYGGYYEHDTGIITVVYDEEDNNVPSTIIHELIHYIQEHRGNLPKKYNYDFGSFEEGYDISIKKYFTMNWWEMEALYYQHKYYKNDLSNYWINHCIGLDNFNKV